MSDSQSDAYRRAQPEFVPPHSSGMAVPSAIPLVWSDPDTIHRAKESPSAGALLEEDHLAVLESHPPLPPPTMPPGCCRSRASSSSTSATRAATRRRRQLLTHNSWRALQFQRALATRTGAIRLAHRVGATRHLWQSVRKAFALWALSRRHCQHRALLCQSQRLLAARFGAIRSLLL